MITVGPTHAHTTLVMMMFMSFRVIYRERQNESAYAFLFILFESITMMMLQMILLLLTCCRRMYPMRMDGWMRPSAATTAIT